MTDRIARRPRGRRARATYGADDAHSFAWEPVLAALVLEPGDSLLDVGCGGGVFLRRALQTGCSGVRIVLAEAERLPFANGEFTAVSSLVAFFFFPRARPGVA